MKIEELKIGDRFKVRKNGLPLFFLGWCPIENLPIAHKEYSCQPIYLKSNQIVYNNLNKNYHE